jgi:hypothetical protein
METGEVQISSIHEVERSRLKRDEVQYIDIVHSGGDNHHQGGDVAVKAQERM